MQTVRRRRKTIRRLNYRGVALLSGILVSLIIVLALVIMNPFKTRYPEELINVDTSQKKFGSHEVKKKRTKDADFVLHYPNTHNKELDSTIQSFINKYEDYSVPALEKDAPRHTVFVDYRSNKQFDTFESIQLTAKIDGEEKETIIRTIFNKNQDDLSSILSEKGLAKVTSDVRAVIEKPKNITRTDYLEATNIKNIKSVYFDENDVSFDLFNQSLSIKYEEFATYIQDSIGKLEKKTVEIPSVYHERGIDPSKKMVAFTFDDGPHDENTLAIAKVLESHNGQGTFFMVGNRIEGREDILNRLLDGGHQIASHSYSHPNLNALPISEVTEELTKTEKAIRDATGIKNKIMVRPPYGNANETVLNGTDVTFVNWSVDSEDWLSRDPHSICSMIDKYSFDGSIILLHDIYETSYKGFNCAIEKLKAQGYEFVTVDELINAREGNPNTKTIYYEVTQ